MTNWRAGVVSVVLVNYRGAETRSPPSLLSVTLDWPTERLEIIVVDNASGDDSVARIRAAAPDVIAHRVRREPRLRGRMQPRRAQQPRASSSRS